jgi:hypothetical protein
MDETVPPYESWITLESTPDAILLRVAVIVAIGVVALILAKAAFEAGEHVLRDVLPRRVRRHVAGPDPLPWDPAFWICGSCLSSNRVQHPLCKRCGVARATGELRAASVAPAPDVVPATIPVSHFSTLRLAHDPAAHVDPGAPHWKLLVGGAVAGSVASTARVGELLGSVRGAEYVLFDALGTGTGTYRINELAFARRPSPLRVPCPERLVF